MRRESSAARSNEYAAKLVADYPGRFGNFAMLPLTDAEGSLRELTYALDTLKADGIALMTSYGDKWLGDPLFLPVMEELNRRKALVYTHPTAANCCVNLVPTQPPVMIEFGTDTTRTIADIVFSGNARRFPDIRWIFSHAGGTMPFLIERFVRHPLLVPKAKETVPDGTLAELKRFYLRHRADLEPRLDVGIGGDHPAVADRVRNGFPVPDRHRSCEGVARGGCVYRRTDRGDRARQCAQADTAARKLVWQQAELARRRSDPPKRKGAPVVRHAFESCLRSPP